MPFKQIKCETLYNRLFNCSFFKMENNYAKTIKSLFTKIIKEYKTHINNRDVISFYDIVSKSFNSRKLTGVRYVNSSDRELYMTSCTRYAKFINDFFTYAEVLSIHDEYLFKKRIRGVIAGKVKLFNKVYLFDIAYTEPVDISYNKFNMYLYNIVNNTNYDYLIISLSNLTIYKINFNSEDYILPNNFITFAVKWRGHRQGSYCIFCKEVNCAARALNNINKLEI